jgi:flagellar biosynthesis protein FliR
MEVLFRILDLPGLREISQMAGLIFIRLLPLVVLSPVFGGPALPRRLRMGMTVVLTVALLPAFAASFAQTVPWDRYAALVAKEAVVGLTLAFFVLIIFETLSATGALIDLARGATLANVLDPLTQQQQSILSTFFLQLGIVLFFTIGGHRLLFLAIGQSFVLLRPFDLLPPMAVGPSATPQLVALLGELFLVAIQLAAPAVIVLFLLDFTLGVLNRAAPQMQMFFLSLSMKGSLGLLIVFVGLAFLLEQILSHFARHLALLRQWVAGVQ